MESWETQQCLTGQDKERSVKMSSGKASSKRGRKASKMDVKAKLERSRQSARECRARKKLRYQYLEELVANRERAVVALRSELDELRQWCREVDEGNVPPELERRLMRQEIKTELTVGD